MVLGIVGWIPVSGVTWQALHYLEGFRRLGFDVYYVEDTGEWPYDPERNTFSDDPSYNVRYLTNAGEFLPTGEGLFAFSSIEDIMSALDEINGSYERQRRASRCIAEEYFRAETVLAKMMDTIGGIP